MGYHYHTRNRHCRWCGKAYIATKPPDRDGFCTATCKQAHYRHYKAYVTVASRDQLLSQVKSVTPKSKRWVQKHTPIPDRRT